MASEQRTSEELPTFLTLGESFAAYIGIPALLLYPVGLLMIATQLSAYYSLESYTALYAASLVPAAVIASQGAKVVLVPLLVILVISPLSVYFLGRAEYYSERQGNPAGENGWGGDEYYSRRQSNPAGELIFASVSAIIAVWLVLVSVTVATRAVGYTIDYANYYWGIFLGPAAIAGLIGGYLMARDRQDKDKPSDRNNNSRTAAQESKLAAFLRGDWLWRPIDWVWRPIAEGWVFRGLVVAYFGSVVSAVFAVIFLAIILNQNASLPYVQLTSKPNNENWSGENLLLLSHSDGYWHVINPAASREGDFISIPDDSVRTVTLGNMPVLTDLNLVRNTEPEWTSAVTVSLDAEDTEGSGVKEIVYWATGAHEIEEKTVGEDSTKLSISSEGETTINYFARDNMGNTSDPDYFSVKVDDTDPTVECYRPDDIWHKEAASMSCTARDEGSGLADPDDASFSLYTDVPRGVETDNAEIVSYEVCDKAENCAPTEPVRGIKVDNKAPEVVASAHTS